MPPAAPKIQSYIDQFEKTLVFTDTLWWIIDYQNDPGFFRCSKHMVEAFELDNTNDRHSIELTCPIAGDLRHQIKVDKQRARVFDDYNRLLRGEINEFNNHFPFTTRQSNEVKYFDSRATVLERDEHGKARVMYGLLNDVTTSVVKRHQYAKTSANLLTQIDEQEALIDLLQAELARDALCQEHDYGFKWRLNLQRRLIQPDAVLARWHGRGWKPDHWFPIEDLHESVPQSHYQAAADALEAEIKNLSVGGTFTVERPITREDTGEIAWVKWYGKLICHNDEQIAFGQAIDITEQVNRKRELETLLERQRSMFAILGHELRTPTAAINMLTQDRSSPANLILDQIHDVSEGLLTVLEDLRVVIAPERAAEYQLESTCPKSVIERAIRPLVPIVHREGLILEFASQMPESNYLIYQQLLRQSVTNLVKNAAVHSKGTQVHVNFSINSEQTEAKLTVEDDGIGLPAPLTKTMYEPFIKGDDSSEGSGIGLFVAKDMAKRMRGNLDYSKSQLGGAKFTLTFPIERTEVTKPPTVMKVDLTGLRILLAEDDLLIRTLTHQALGRAGAQVSLAENGKVALEKFDPELFDLVLTDIMMPEVDGFEFTREVRKQDGNMPIIALTAAVLGEETDRIQDLGANAVLPKPIDLNRLIETLQKLGIRLAA